MKQKIDMIEATVIKTVIALNGSQRKNLRNNTLKNGKEDDLMKHQIYTLLINKMTITLDYYQ
jgi:hypothetical protein